MDKMQEYRLDGMKYALRIAIESGIDGLKQEVERRTRNMECLPMTKKQREEVIFSVAKTSRDIITLGMAAVLRDEFDFGAKRIQRAIDRLDSKMECIYEGHCSLEDYYEVLKEELGENFHYESEGKIYEPFSHRSDV